MCLTEYKCKCDVNADFYSASYAPSMPMSVHTGKFLPVRRYASAVTGLWLCLRLSVRLAQVGVLSKRINGSSYSFCQRDVLRPILYCMKGI